MRAWGKSHTFPAMVGEYEFDPAQVRGRLIALRYALGQLTQAKFADEIGVEPNRYAKIESTGKLSVDVAFRIRHRWRGVDLEWLYFGADDRLPLWLARSLTPPKPPSKTVKTRKSGSGA